MSDDTNNPGTPGNPNNPNNIVHPSIHINQKINPLNIESEMQSCYLDYAMSVIVGRALPDVRDGLKPVHRRSLYAMHELNNVYGKPYLKSARVVGDVMGKYHPHGDSAIYQTIVRMAQPFSQRYTLVDGQGNFGSIDGDNAAAMRYTEVRMEKITNDMLVDIDKNTVDFVPNYDDKLKEPSVLPTRIPNLLVNGSSGIAVGMATHIPPHNLTEVLEGLKATIENPSITSQELIKYIKGPDFPTAGFLIGRQGIHDAYTKGRGVVQMRGKAEIEIYKKEKERIIITEIPYMINKAQLVTQIAELVRDKRIEGISDIRDESNRTGIRVVVDIKKGAAANVILNNLYKLTALQSSFGIIFLALVNNIPKVLNIKEMLDNFIAHRKEVVIRRTQYELAKALEKAHLLEGLKIAVENIDEIVALIKAAKDADVAKTQLMKRFELSVVQAQAILEMRLQRLTGLERDKIISDYLEVLELIKKLKTILSSEALIFKIILDELEEIKNKYGDERKTVLMDAEGEMSTEDFISDDLMVITRTHNGYIKRDSVTNYKSQKRGGRGVIGMATRDEDFVETIYTATNHASLLFFTNLGKCFTLKVHEIPQATRTSKGTAIVNLLELGPNEKPMTIVPVKEFKEGHFVIIITSKGIIKKMEIMHFQKVMKKGIIAIRLEDEELISAKIIKEDNQNIFIGTKEGQSIRFDHKDLRDMGRTARGVRGIALDTTDVVVGSEILDPHVDAGAILTVTEKGYGKRTMLEEYRQQGRGGSGVKTIQVTDKTGNVVSMKQVRDMDDIIVITTAGNIIRTKVKDISIQGRNTQGVRIVRLAENESVAGVAKIESDGQEAEELQKSENLEVAQAQPVAPEAVEVREDEGTIQNESNEGDSENN